MSAKRVQLRRILCPTDFSEFSTYALRHAAALSQRFDAQLSVLHVMPFTGEFGASMPYFPTVPLVANPQLEKMARRNLQEFVKPVLSRRMQISLELRNGEPWREIRERAESLPADLLVMGTHGFGGFERLLLGSVTEKVVRTATCPVMTVCHEEGRSWDAPGLVSRILCAVDLSAASAHTIDLALSLAAEHQARLTLLHVVESHGRGGGAIGTDAVELAEEQLRRAASDEARSWCAVEERVEAGKPYTRILQLAAEERSDLIVLGSGARNALGSTVFGSTPQHVVRAATCPVLMVPPRTVRAFDVAHPEETRALRAV